VIIFRDTEESSFTRRKRIDVWWGGLNANGGLMLILAYLLRTSIEWRGAEINLKLMVNDENAAQAARSNLNHLVQQLRMGATPRVIISEGKSFPEILRQHSKRADLVFLGMAIPQENENYSQYYEKMQKTG
jgi:hypothetical protein